MTEEKQDDKMLGKSEEAKQDTSELGEIAAIDSSVTAHAADVVGLSIKKEEAEMGKKPEKKFSVPKLFVEEEDEIVVDLDVLFDYENGEVYTVARKGLLSTSLQKDLFESVAKVEYYAKFKPVSYDNMTMYRKASQFYDSATKTMVVNRHSMRNLLIMNHLFEWNVPGRDGKIIELKIDKEKDNLTIDSLSEVFKAIPVFIDVMMTIFEQKLMTTLGDN